jgi:hypothetical protein
MKICKARFYESIKCVWHFVESELCKENGSLQRFTPTSSKDFFFFNQASHLIND